MQQTDTFLGLGSTGPRPLLVDTVQGGIKLLDAVVYANHLIC